MHNSRIPSGLRRATGCFAAMHAAGFTDVGATRRTRCFARSAAALTATACTASLRCRIVGAGAIAGFFFFGGFWRLADDFRIDEYLDSQKSFKCFRAILFRSINGFDVKAGELLADDALGVKVNAPEATPSEDRFADNHLTQAFFGKVPDVPVEGGCVDTAALHRIYNIHLKAEHQAQQLAAVRVVTSPDIMPKRSERPATSLDSGIFC